MATSLYAPDFLSIFNRYRDTGGPTGAFPSPQDWRDQWIYFLMVDRFNNSQYPPVHQPFDDPNYYDFQGGNLASIQDKLPYIQGLGAGAIWLSPVLKNVPNQGGTYHGYGIRDFLHVDPRFARDAANADDELRNLVDAAHKLGIYVILDIVLNHTGDVFAYVCDAGETDCTSSQGAQADYRSFARPVQWRDQNAVAQSAWTDIAALSNMTTDPMVWPKELQQNEYFRRQGAMPAPDDDTIGDFDSLKQMMTDNPQLQQFLIRSYQYAIARFDIDGFRIDTLRYLKNGLPQLFGNSIREFAMSIGKKNFFTFGEVLTGDSEQVIAEFIGRNTSVETSDLSEDEMVGVDAALDYPLFYSLKPVVKAEAAPSGLVGMYEYRKQEEGDILSSHGDATRFFVTFLDNHDMKERIRYVDPTDATRFDDQVTLGLASLFCLPGIPCVYYGTEQGLHGAGTDPAVREALWGGPGFGTTDTYYEDVAAIAAIRKQSPALRYGRFYFRPISGDGKNFGVSTFLNGTLAFSRILMDQEILVVANTDTANPITVNVIVDLTLHVAGDALRVLYSNKANPAAVGNVVQLASGSVVVAETDGSTGIGPLNCVQVTLQPMEVQIIGK
jgi:glycosidase